MFNTPTIFSLTLLLTLPLLFFYSSHILPPKHPLIPPPTHSSLFRRAILSSIHPLTESTRANSPPKIVFLFLTNTDLHFAPLWQKFFNPKHQNLYNIYVHAYPSSAVKNPGGVFHNRFIAAKKTQRASPTLISAARRLLSAAILDDPLNYYFALVSQTCIPLHSFHYTYKTLFHDSHQPTESTRLSYIEVLSEEPQLWDRYNARGENVMLPEVPFEKFRVGSQFFILTRKHSLMVVKERKMWNKFRLPCLNVESCYPEEHYFPTLLSMKDLKGVSQHTLTRVNWTDSVGGHPHTYNPTEVSPELIRTLRVSNTSSSYLFARKFAPECLPALMEMADDVIFRE
ncbi:glycosyltransferase BC10-like [Rutidosis leptorrhynchoides]|uniref:glycosyltransferase BC10-like n=1 Tax=Rutidosis leptorrhynchoides TaxID=125765 RepID=UPI003A996230